MGEVARAAKISRPGLYLLFSSKEVLFRRCVFHALNTDLAKVELTMAQSNRPIQERLLDAFCLWVTRYLGPTAREISAVIEENPSLLGDAVRSYPLRFAKLISDAVVRSQKGHNRMAAEDRVQTLISVSIGLKYQVSDIEAYRRRLRAAVKLLF